MKIKANTPVFIGCTAVLAGVIALFLDLFTSQAVLGWYFFGLVLLSCAWLGMRSESPPLKGLSVILALSYYAEKQSYIWENPNFLALAHITGAIMVFSFCRGRDKAHLYITSLFLLKSALDVYWSALLTPYTYQAMLNGVSILALVWLGCISFERRKLVDAVETSTANQNIAWRDILNLPDAILPHSWREPRPKKMLKNKT